MKRPPDDPGSMIRTALGLTLCGLFLLGAPASFGHAGQGGVAGEHRTEQHVVPIKLQLLLERQGLGDSRILDAEIGRQGQAWVYEIKVLGPDGVVRELRYNALNGDPLPNHHH